MDATQALRHYFGYESFRGEQERVIRASLRGRDVVAVLPTGAGKSVCFQIPAVVRRGLTVVVSPLVSLVEDQVSGARRRGIAAFGWTQTTPRTRVTAALNAAGRRELDLLYLSPERLSLDGVCERLAELGLSALAVDEAHCISQWGFSFRPSYLGLRTARERLGWPPTAALTATATWRVRRDIERALRLRNTVRILASGNRPNLRWEVRRVQSPGEAWGLIERAVTSSREPAIVYARTRKRSARLALELTRRGVSAGAYHARLPHDRRQVTQERFLSGALRVVCATTAFGMGIDHPGVRLVAHLGAPESLEEYVQEAGRAGRDGAPARCLLADISSRRRRPWRPGRQDPGGKSPDAAELERRAGMRSYVETRGCRREAIARYFGERTPRCTGCDNCFPGEPGPRRA